MLFDSRHRWRSFALLVYFEDQRSGADGKLVGYARPRAVVVSRCSMFRLTFLLKLDGCVHMPSAAGIRCIDRNRTIVAIRLQYDASTTSTARDADVYRLVEKNRIPTFYPRVP